MRNTVIDMHISRIAAVTWDTMSIPGGHHPIQTQPTQHQRKLRHTESSDVVIHVEKVMILHVDKDGLYWIVDTVVHLYPHSLDSMILK
jgi:hypothetical protein